MHPANVMLLVIGGGATAIIIAENTVQKLKNKILIKVWKKETRRNYGKRNN